MIGPTILAVVFAIYALVAGLLDRLSTTAPMVFVVAGGIMGPGGTCLTAGPVAARYGARMRSLRGVPELVPTGEQRLRTRALSSPGSHAAGTADSSGDQSGDGEGDDHRIG